MSQPQQTTYTNPVINADFPDPSVIYVPGDGYYAYATHDEFSPTINNIQVSKSVDLVNWSEPEGALAEPPVWAKNCHKYWAPQVVKVGNQYRLYYAAEPDTKDGMCLAMAVSERPYHFLDMGKPLAQVPGSTYQMIDPCFFYDTKTGKNLLYYGSAHEPIRVVEVADDGYSFISKPIVVLNTKPGVQYESLREGAFVTYQSSYDRYFLWVSGDNTWAENGYAVSIFWSDDPQKEFQPVPGNHIILKPNEQWDSPGQNCILTDEAGNDWIMYHAVDPADRFNEGTDHFKRKMCMDRVFYNEEGWPEVEGNSPSFTKVDLS
ncbi:glycoside hydrolase family 43 protein [Mucilaginibacter arboris]|uniref:Family 43 glycosylhydrolase n=1 Tax=Mucilaginibacter arboris TaxID=2682090 RepID=A0A7K1SX12_9SPHI|nr:family 43 glycosylhydrolase [Mucilaginibacter arboris]MVN21859.1 family 43 glycosylhydrolase [Mucilaginibacter arboris]